MTFDPVEICAVLDEEGVEFVILGGFAAIIHGSPLPTDDIDVIPSREGDNPERLVFTPAGDLQVYEQWLEGSRRAQLREGLSVAVASLDDIIASKNAANRPKDQRALPYLESLRDQLG